MHTPGPWQADGDEIMADDYTKHVATAWNNDQIEPDESTANARLMAAAPKMLAALKRIADLEEEHDGEDFEVFAIHAEKIAVEAIAEATGEASDVPQIFD